MLFRFKTCLSCNIECKTGCSGPFSFECNKCRGYKITLTNLEKLLKQFLNTDESTIAELNQFTLKSKLFDLTAMDLENKASNILIDLLRDYKNYFKQLNDNKLLSIEENDETTVFCTSECPAEMRYSTFDFNCTDKLE